MRDALKETKMALEYKVETLEGMDESIKSLYEEKVDGNKKYYTLSVNGVKPKEEFDTVYKALQAERDLKKSFEAKYKEFGENTPEGIKSLQEELEALKAAKKSNTEEDFIRRLNEQKASSVREMENYKNTYTAEKTALEQEIKKRDAEILNMRLESELTAKYSKKGDPTGLSLAYAAAKEELEWNEDHKEFRTKDGLGKIDDWLDSDLFKNHPCLLKGSYSAGANGSSNSSATYDKYFDRSSPEYGSDAFLSKRAEFYRKEPEKAEALIQKYKKK